MLQSFNLGLFFWFLRTYIIEIIPITIIIVTVITIRVFGRHLFGLKCTFIFCFHEAICIKVNNMVSKYFRLGMLRWR